MKQLRYTLVTDGSSDAVLIPILTWTLIENGVSCAIQPEWADLRKYPIKKKLKLHEKISLSLHYYPCDLLFIHRDAEKESLETRKKEIYKAIEKIPDLLPAICVVPVRMQEAWLLFDEKAIRHAAGNRSGHQPLQLPPIKKIEKIPNPKIILHNSLKQASNLRGRRLKQFPVNRYACRVAEFIEDFSPLRGLSAFNALEKDLIRIIELNNMNG